MYHWQVSRTCNRYEWYTLRSGSLGQSTVPGVLLCLATLAFFACVGDAGDVKPPTGDGVEDGVEGSLDGLAGEADRVCELDGAVAPAAADAMNSVSAAALTAILDRVPSFDAQAQIGTTTIHPTIQQRTWAQAGHDRNRRQAFAERSLRAEGEIIREGGLRAGWVGSRSG